MRESKVNSLVDIKRLITSGDNFDLHELVRKSVEQSKTIEVLVISGEHANCDSLPLRYGMHFDQNSTIILNRVSYSKKVQRVPDRIGLTAHFLDSNNLEQFGEFVIGSRSGFNLPILITVWRNDADTEKHLSEVMISLRKRGWLSPSALRELHPKYIAGEIATHADLVELLAKNLSEEKVKSLREIVTDYEEKINTVKAERDSALQTANETKIHNDLLTKDNAEKDRFLRFYKEELERYKRDEIEAKRDGKEAILSSPDILKDVLTNQLYRGSSCTILIMGDGTKRYMKTSIFDPRGIVTAHAISLKNKRVRISFWDPINEPGKWSKQGYFRNIYAVE